MNVAVFQSYYNLSVCACAYTGAFLFVFFPLFYVSDCAGLHLSLVAGVVTEPL